GFALEPNRLDASVVLAWLGLGEHHQRAGDAAVGDELLGAAEHVLVAVPLGARLHGRRVRSAARLGQRVGGDLLAGCERRTQSLFLLLASGDEDGVGAESLYREDERRAR